MKLVYELYFIPILDKKNRLYRLSGYSTCKSKKYKDSSRAHSAYISDNKGAPSTITTKINLIYSFLKTI